MPNSINTLSPDFRDFLLERNIISDTIENNGLFPLLQGIGFPGDIYHSPETVQPSEDIEVNGVFYKDLNIVQNKFQVDDAQYRSVDINNIPGNTTPFSVSDDASFYQQLNITQNTFRAEDNDYVDASIYLNTSSAPTIQMGAYLDEFGNLNVGGPSTGAIDIVGSILGGNGVGFDPNGGGLVPDYDVRSSLAGRVLTSAGLINDTKLGQLSVGYLAAAIGNNVAFNIQQETLGHINLNPISLIKGGNVIRPNFNITVAKGTLGKVVDILERIIGFETPISLLERGSSIFHSESGNISTIDRANSMIENTGKGQVLSLFANLNANSDTNLIGKRIPYVPNYEDKRTERGFNQEPYSGGSSYAFNDKTTLTKYPSDLEGGYNEDFGNTTLGPEYDVSSNHWIDEHNNIDRDFGTLIEADRFTSSKSILYKTQELFKSNKMRTLTSGHHVKSETRTDIQTAVRQGGYMSKGSGVLTGGVLDPNNEKIFCRTWSSNDRYNQIENLQKHSGINPLTRQNGESYPNSVLDDNGMVRIGPYKGEDIKKFMFSIENLAWIGEQAKLLPCEQGPGDLLTGNFGRIMWFPPYDMSFNESTSVSWDKSNFIGRGEPVYTYNNTERTGTLSWKIIVDHPNYMNFMSEMTSDEINSFFSGCLEAEGIRENILTKDEIEEIKVAEVVKQPEKVDDETVETVTFNVYFANDNSDIPTLYENGLKNDSDTPDEKIIFSETPGGIVPETFYPPFSSIPILIPSGVNYGTKTTLGQGPVGSVGRIYNDNTNFGLNGQTQQLSIAGSDNLDGWQDPKFSDTLNSFLKEKCRFCKITINGYASTPGGSGANLKLSQNRANSINKWLLNDSGIVPSDDEFREKRIKQEFKGAGETEAGSTPCVFGQEDSESCKRSRVATIKIEYDPTLKEEVKPTPTKVDVNAPQLPQARIPISRFFNECNYFEKLEQTDNFVFDNIKQKIPFFHPGFHSITPEGFNSRLTFLQQCTRQGPTNKDNNPDNLAFGRPPVCILRIGDFYHTKIIIDNLTFDYDPLVWDLNPEGVGVQPMIVTVNMSFAFIGGSSLNSPINRLQNAVSFNYFANTEVYDPRAQRVKLKDGINEKKQGEATGEIVEGTFPNSKNVIKDSDKSEGINSDNTNEPVLDQELIAELEAIEDSEEMGDFEGELDNDLNVISGIRLVNFTKDVGDDILTLGFSYDPKPNCTYKLNGGFNANVFYDLLGEPGNVEIGKLEANYNTDTSFTVLTYNNLVVEEVIIDENNTGSFNLDMLLNFEDSTRLDEIIDSGGVINLGILHVNWDTGHKTQINMTKEIGI